MSYDQELIETLEKWYKATNRKQIILVTAGRSGVGKSTLIRNMLNLKGAAAPKTEHGPSSTTQSVKIYASTVGGVQVRIIDMPGLAATDVDELESIADLQEASGAKADMLLYCISLLPDSKIDQLDQKIIKKLTLVFGNDIWNHTILVFTFANVAKLLHSDIPELARAYADKFQLVLQRECPSFSVVSVFSCDQDQPQRPSTTIVALPAGRDPNEELVKGMKWDESIYLEALKKCNREAIPALLKVRSPTPRILRMAKAIGQYISATGSAAAVGTVAGAIIGGAIGGGVGLLAVGIGIGPGAASGAQFGASIAAASIGGLSALDGGIEVHSEITKYEKEQADLEKIQDGLQEIHSKKRKRKIPPPQWDGKDCPGKVKIRKQRHIIL